MEIVGLKSPNVYQDEAQTKSKVQNLFFKILFHYLFQDHWHAMLRKKSNGRPQGLDSEEDSDTDEEMASEKNEVNHPQKTSFDFLCEIADTHYYALELNK